MVGELMHPQDYMKTLWETMYPTIINRMGPIKGKKFLKGILLNLQYSSDVLLELATGERFMIIHDTGNFFAVWTVKTGTKQKK